MFIVIREIFKSSLSVMSSQGSPPTQTTPHTLAAMMKERLLYYLDHVHTTRLQVDVSVTGARTFPMGVQQQLDRLPEPGHVPCGQSIYGRILQKLPVGRSASSGPERKASSGTTAFMDMDLAAALRLVAIPDLHPSNQGLDAIQNSVEGFHRHLNVESILEAAERQTVLEVIEWFYANGGSYCDS